jgi:hypothetical protein
MAAQSFEMGVLLGARTGGTFTDPDTNRDQQLEAGYSMGFLAEIPVLGPGRYVQLLWSRQRSSLELSTLGKVDVTLDYVHLGGAYRWRDDGPLSSYVAAGVGVTVMTGGEGSGTTVEPSGSLALGLRWAASRRLGLRVEGRGYGTINLNEGGLYCSGGCLVTLSGGGTFQLEGSAVLSVVF